MAASANTKTLNRIAKLLALASPTSGAERPERESAALEAAKLIAESGAIVVSAPSPIAPPAPPQRPRYRPAAYVPMPTHWAPAVAIKNDYCEMCGGAIRRGEMVYYLPGHHYLHGGNDWAEPNCGRQR